MKFSKQASITLAAAVLAIGVTAVATPQADASYYYKYTDKRPPVLTPSYMPVATPTSTTTEAVTANNTSAKTTATTAATATTTRATATNSSAPRYSDYDSPMAYSLALGQYFMARINAMFNGNTAFNRYGVR